jgi:hypothetical protein
MSSYAFVRPHGELGWLPARGTQGGVRSMPSPRASVARAIITWTVCDTAGPRTRST